MRKPRPVVTVAAAIVLTLIVAAISIPNLMRSRARRELMTQKATGLGVSGYLDTEGRVPKPMAMAARLATPAAAGDSDFAAKHKIIRTAELELVVKDVRASLERIRTATVELGGYVEKAVLGSEGGGSQSGQLVLRVPQNRLETALVGFKQDATRVDKETIESRDVTREFVDTEARLRNLHAEEVQYLTILKRASTVKDTLEVSEKLGEVRGEIESVQGQLNYLSHEVEMSSITVDLRPQVPITVAALEWHPLVKARLAWREMLAGLADYADTMIAVLVNLPLILAWMGTVLAGLFGAWRLFRWMRPRFFAAKPSATA